MFVFGSDPNSFGQPQKSLVVVASSTCTSSPITASYSAIAQDSSTMTNACSRHPARPGPLPDRARRPRQRRDAGLRVRGRRRRPAAARARLPGDEAHLVAQHDAARRRRLRGDRARPARPRRVEPRARRLLRHRRVLEGPLHARARRARPRALLRRGRRRRRPGRLRPQPALPGLRQEALLLQHRHADPPRRVRGRGHPARRARGRCGRPPTTSSARPPTPKGCSRSSTPRSADARTSPTCTATGSGRRAVRSPRTRSTS